MAVIPEELFVTIVREDLGDYHGAVPHRGRVRCPSCGATFAYESSLSNTTFTRETEFDQVMALLREGKQLQVGGGRIFEWYAIKDGQLVMTSSDDGYTTDTVITEERFRQIVAEEQKLFLEYIQMYQRA